MSKIFWPNAESASRMKRFRIWCQKFGPGYARSLNRRQGRLGNSWYLDEVFIRINGQQHYLWRAVDQDGDVIDILVQPRRDQRGAERFFRRLLRSQGKQPFRIITDKLRSYSVGHSNDSGRSRARHGTVMPTIALKFRISLPGKGNGTCAGSNLLVRRNGSSLFTEQSRIFSDSVATC
jgi:IS1 family transposase